jgi:acyl-CoA synthetase (AMP-forming)/AMP-acid ligase II
VCKTVGVPHATLGEIVVSCIVREAERALTEDDVLRFLKERLAVYKVPRKVLFVTEDELNLTGTAKIKPAEARALAARRLAQA